MQPSQVTAETDAETPPEQQQQQWQPRDIDIWAAEEVKAMLGRLDNNGIYSQRVAQDTEAALISFLGRSSTLFANFQARQARVHAIEQLLQRMLGVGFSDAHIRKAVRQPRVLTQSPARVHATLQQLKRLGDMTDRQAVAALGSNPNLLSSPSDSLPARLQKVHHITGLSTNQSATMLRRSVQPLNISSNNLQASVDGFSGPTLLPPCIPLCTAVPY